MIIVEMNILIINDLTMTGWRPSLLGWRPLLLVWRPSLLGWWPSLCFSHLSSMLEVLRGPADLLVTACLRTGLSRVQSSESAGAVSLKQGQKNLKQSVQLVQELFMSCLLKGKCAKLSFKTSSLSSLPLHPPSEDPVHKRQFAAWTFLTSHSSNTKRCCLGQDRTAAVQSLFPLVNHRDVQLHEKVLLPATRSY